ncbi:MAG: hypothetical protein AAF513_14405, partial [Pseudomonadota bacterium]
DLDLDDYQLAPAHRQPWRKVIRLTQPRILRGLAHDSFVMLNDAGQTMRVVTRVNPGDCTKQLEWLSKTLEKKYETHAVPWPASDKLQDVGAFRISFSDRLINVRCDRSSTLLDYADIGAIRAWIEKQKKRYRKHESELRQIAKRRMILENRRSLSFADTFALGTAMRLEGGFGIRFKKPFAPRSSQKFPIDTPFIVGLPNLPEDFVDGEIRLMLTPERHPISIRGRFDNVTFDRVARALAAKYGTPFKDSQRHVIHKIARDHIILRQLSEATIELAFIDTEQQDNYKHRLWLQESEGL